MNVSKIVLILIQALLKIVIASMREQEKNLDADGCPLNEEEYNNLSYFRCHFVELLKDFNLYEEKDY